MTCLVINSFLSGSGQVSITSQTFADSVIDPADAFCRYRLNSNGNVEKYTGGVYSTLEVWLLSGVNSDYESRVTVNSGSLTSGTTGTWQVLSSSREWIINRTLVGTSSVNLTVEIRRASDAVVLDAATINMTADIDV